MARVFCVDSPVAECSATLEAHHSSRKSDGAGRYYSELTAHFLLQMEQSHQLGWVRRWHGEFPKLGTTLCDALSQSGEAGDKARQMCACDPFSWDGIGEVIQLSVLEIEEISPLFSRGSEEIEPLRIAPRESPPLAFCTAGRNHGDASRESEQFGYGGRIGGLECIESQFEEVGFPWGATQRLGRF